MIPQNRYGWRMTDEKPTLRERWNAATEVSNGLTAAQAQEQAVINRIAKHNGVTVEDVLNSSAPQSVAVHVTAYVPPTYQQQVIARLTAIA
jgi:hypothetical protein